MEEESLGDNDARVKVSMFDYSVENHFKAVDTISKLCGAVENFAVEECEIQRLSDSVTFLREWSYYNYKPKIIRFGSESQASSIFLPQLSSANVPKEGPHEKTKHLKDSKDFMFYVGGPVWALDWCPRVHKRSDFHVKNEFIAVSAHPPDSTHHKIGARLIGRGMIQIWCILNTGVCGEAKEDKPTNKKKPKVDKPTDTKKPRGRPRKKPVNEDVENLLTQPKRPRGRPQKYPRDESVDSINFNNQLVQALAVQYPEGTSEFLATEGASANTQEDSVRENNGKRHKSSTLNMSAYDSDLKNSMQKRVLKRKARSCKIGGDVSHLLLTENEDKVSSATDYHIDETSGKDIVVSNNVSDNSFMDIGSAACSIPDDVALPRIVLCLAHDGKVAWDVKWRPLKESDFRCIHRMGYLAALLRNGSLHVWDVPLPHAMKSIYSSSCKEGIDPCFVKLEPYTVDSRMVNFIPPRLLACWMPRWNVPFHTGILISSRYCQVVLWKFSAGGSTGDTKPLLCFSADTVPIRAVAWAPVGGDREGANVILTAGHGGMKFWDIRDPFRPLWEIHPAPRFIYSLDWLQDPSCVILSLDDGTMRLLSFVKSAYDVPVYGRLIVGPKHLGLHTYNCSSFAIWSVQVSRLTGMVAYCSADGTVICFQLTRKAVEKDFARNRAPNFVCGSLCVDESALVVCSSLVDTALTLKKPTNDNAEAPRSMQGFLSPSNHLKRCNDKKAKSPILNNHTLGLCYEDDPATECGTDETLASCESKTIPKSRSSKQNAEDDQGFVCEDEEPDIHGKENRNVGKCNKTEDFPSKTVAMHRVRWNMNKGSERWLCYGGAAGIVRCQEIMTSHAAWR
ncbi:uncharacterized protein LOC120003150 isoform X1 [Tripterygium wilfordii]|uniref:uncharacterized protein LOC120003150 isoform X1 n=2 Tax=Tripterygium wilfordii TaxID=458696 RepID=UPI0018F800B6|nr:uncharacterized protein LOC120003150 isoform X1 [Tripterygium wilfordii]